MPRVSLPEHSRANAMRSRWFGSMLAWILNTKADMFCSSASTVRLSAFCARGGGAMRADGVEQIADAEILQRRAEEHRAQMAFAERLQVERLAGVAHQLDLLGDRVGVEIGIERRDLGDAHLAQGAGLAGVALQQTHAAAFDRDGADEIAAAADRPVHRRGVERERLLDLVEQIERIAALAVELVDEGDDRDVAQPADLEQLAGARLDALGGVDHHHRRIDRGQRAVGVLGEVLVARRVEQVEDAGCRIRRSSPR